MSHSTLVSCNQNGSLSLGEDTIICNPWSRLYKLNSLCFNYWQLHLAEIVQYLMKISFMFRCPLAIIKIFRCYYCKTCYRYQLLKIVTIINRTKGSEVYYKWSLISKVELSWTKNTFNFILLARFFIYLSFLWL